MTINNTISSQLHYLLFFAALLLVPACEGTSNESVPDADAPKKYNAEPERIAGLARVEPEHGILKLIPQATGIIQAVHAKVSDSVQKDDLLIEIEHQAEDGKIAIHEAQIKTHEAVIRELKSGKEKLTTAASYKKEAYERLRKAYDQGAGTRQEVDNAKSGWDMAQADLRMQEAKIETANKQLEEMRANLRLSVLARNAFFLKAPANGILLSFDAIDGSLATASKPIGELAVEGPVSVLTEIDELFASKVKINQPAFIRMQGATDTLATGRVIEASPALQQKSIFSDETGKLEDRRVRVVKVRLEKGQDRVLYGQRVECLIGVAGNK